MNDNQAHSHNSIKISIKLASAVSNKNYYSEMYTVKDLGCWDDVTADRAIQTLEGDKETAGILDGHYGQRTDAYNKCLKATLLMGK